MRLTIAEQTADHYLGKIQREAPPTVTLVGAGRNAGFACYLGTRLEDDGYVREDIKLNRRDRGQGRTDLVEICLTLHRPATPD